MNKNESVVIAAFVNQAAAEAAIEHLREWDKRVGEVKLGAIAKVHYENGKIESEVVHGGFFNRSLPISDDALRLLVKELDSRVAVVVACDDYEAGMVSDSLIREGGLILAISSERTAEDIAKEEKNVTDALTEEAINKAAAEAKLSPGRNIHRPV